MSEEEVEKFEITDYDLDNEFNINRPRKKQSKNEMIYGIWADGSSDDEEAPRRAQFKGGKKPKNYSAPIGFVAGEVQQSGKKEKPPENEEESESRQGLGAGKNMKLENEYLGHTSSDSQEEDEQGEFYSKSQYNDDFETTGEIAGMRKKKAFTVDKSLMQKGVGNWEKHTKGIGAKLLLQMGYKPGKGLGKELQGISAPIEAKLRKGRGAIGAYGPEVAAKIADTPMPNDAKEKKEFTEKLSRWRKDDTASNKHVKYVYKSIDEVIKQGQNKSTKHTTSELSKVKVIDMTGPQQRVLSGYHAISGQQMPSDEWEIRKDKKFANFALPELLHNLNLLVERCEQDIIQSDRKYKFTSDKIISLEQDVKTLDKMSQVKEKEILQLEKLLQIIEELMSKDKSNKTQLQLAADKFYEMQENNPEEYKLYDMSELATTLIIPMLKELLSTWDPLVNPEEHVEVYRQWKLILETDCVSVLSNSSSPDPYSRLIWESWVPSIRLAVSNWNARKADCMILLIQSWISLLPNWVLDNVLESLILPRLTLHVKEWDPMTDVVPIHSWIQPWIMLLGKRLDTVIYPTIRMKLSVALTAWHPSDRSAKLVLIPWAKAFGKGEMDAFLIKNILPKLAATLDEFIINPQNQILDEHWKWVMEWEDLLPVVSLATILEKHFFPKWLQVLAMWLNHNPNFDEVSSWYMGWKSIFSESLLTQPVIKDQFRRALDLMNRSVGSGSVPGAKESVSYLKNVDRDSSSSNVSSSSRYQSLSDAVRTSSSSVVSSYKSLLMKRCEDNNILLVPITNKYHEGKQVYRCGKLQIYIEKNVIFTFINGIWTPQSLSYILEMANR